MNKSPVLSHHHAYRSVHGGSLFFKDLQIIPLPVSDDVGVFSNPPTIGHLCIFSLFRRYLLQLPLFSRLSDLPTVGRIRVFHPLETCAAKCTKTPARKSRPALLLSSIRCRITCRHDRISCPYSVSRHRYCRRHPQPESR